MNAQRHPQDGKFYADGHRIMRRPFDAGGGVVTFGFAVCEISPALPAEAATQIAGVLNDALERGTLE